MEATIWSRKFPSTAPSGLTMNYRLENVDLVILNGFLRKVKIIQKRKESAFAMLISENSYVYFLHNN